MAKRVTSSTINWNRIMEALGESRKAKFLAFKGQSDKYQRLIANQPAELPKIDWGSYKNKLPPGVIDSFQKSYEQLKVPYPSDKGMLAKVESEKASSIKNAVAYEEKMVKKIEESKKKLKELEALIPYSEMSLEELALSNPEFSFEKPKLWPQFMDKEYPEIPLKDQKFEPH